MARLKDEADIGSCVPLTGWLNLSMHESEAIALFSVKINSGTQSSSTYEHFFVWIKSFCGG